jgi:hypothetical protein
MRDGQPADAHVMLKSMSPTPNTSLRPFTRPQKSLKTSKGNLLDFYIRILCLEVCVIWSWTIRIAYGKSSGTNPSITITSWWGSLLAAAGSALPESSYMQQRLTSAARITGQSLRDVFFCYSFHVRLTKILVIFQISGSYFYRLGVICWKTLRLRLQMAICRRN